MIHLAFSLARTLDSVALACSSLSYNREKIPFSSTRHLVVDLARLVKLPRQKGMNAKIFAAQETGRCCVKG
eukprot:6495294-Prorocentrum_lima.AAC.1